MTTQFRSKPMSSSDLLYLIDGIPGYFTEFSGIDKTNNRPEYVDALSGIVVEGATGSIKFAPATIARPYDPESPDDEALLNWLEQQDAAKSFFDFSLQPVYRVNGLEKRGSKAWYLIDCKIKQFKIFENSNVGTGTDVAKIVIQFSYSKYERK